MIRRLVSGGAVAVLALAPVAVSAQASPLAEPGIEIELSRVSPQVDPDGELVIRGSLHNPGTVAIDDISLDVLTSPRPLASRAAIEDWMDDPGQSIEAASSEDPPADDEDEDDEGSGLRVPDLPDRLEPDQRLDFEFAIPGDEIGYPTTSSIRDWGARGLSVQAQSGQTPLGQADAATVWYPDPTLEPTAVTVLVPFTLQQVGGEGPDDVDALRAAVEPGAPLDLMLQAAGAGTTVLGIDPALLAAVDAALAPQEPPVDPEGGADATTPAVEPSPPAELAALRTWREELDTLTGEREVIALNWSDADLAHLLEGGASELAATAVAGREVVTAAYPDAISDIAWPAAGSLTEANLPGVLAGSDLAILAGAQQPGQLPYTGSAQSSLQLDDPISTLVVDDRQAELLAAVDPGAAVTSSVLLADLAAITAERPFDQRSLFLPLPRSAMADPRLALDLVRDLDAAPWVEVQSLADALDREPIARGPLIDGETSSTGAQELAALDVSAGQFNSFLDDPELADAQIAHDLLFCAAVGTVQGDDPQGCRDRTAQRVDAWTGGLSVDAGSEVLLVTGEQTNIPVQVTNHTDQTARLTVELRPATPQLRATRSEEVEIAPQASARVPVPVEGIANGDVTSTVHLISVTGAELAMDEGQLVRVRADWENIGTAVIAVGLVSVLVFGLVRTFRRGRRKLPPQQLQAVVERSQGPDPIHPRRTE